MVICGECGKRNPDNVQFCTACNAYLEWEGARADQPVPTAAPLPNPGAPPAGPFPRPAAGEPSGARPGAAPGQPAPMHPTEAAPRGRSYFDTKQPRPPSPGDLICGQCGAGNAPTRRFCGRCGSALTEAAVVPIPWWRRLLPKRTRRGRKAPKSGERPRRRRSRGLLNRAFRALCWVLVLLLALSGLAYGLVPGVRGWANPNFTTMSRKVQSIFKPVYVPTRPVGVDTNGQLPDHPADAVSDGFTTTYWAVPAGGPEPILVFRFEHPVNLKRVIVRSGASDNFQASHRPQRLHLVFSTGQTTDLTLVDSPDQQILGLPGSEGATSVEVHIVSLYHAVSGPNLALTEIEFFEQQS